jgi:hypothetical protein
MKGVPEMYQMKGVPETYQMKGVPEMYQPFIWRVSGTPFIWCAQNLRLRSQIISVSTLVQIKKMYINI